MVSSSVSPKDRTGEPVVLFQPKDQRAWEPGRANVSVSVLKQEKASVPI